jgi:hypothetical protein
MITEKTVFILGAGASCPYGFPTGATLRKEICDNFKQEYLNYVNREISKVHPVLKAIAKHKLCEPVNQFVDTFNGSSTNPIDLFLAESSNRLRIGKYIISFKILDAEQKSRFREQSKIKEQDWYSWIFNIMRKSIGNGTEINKFSENNISFITFNYDRSLEHFFYESLCNSFEVPKQVITTILKQLKIIHVYGTIAPLDWQDGKNGIKYGTQISENILKITSQNLRTMREEKQNPELDVAKKLIAEAKKVFFLGFGYADENMRVLGLPGIISFNNTVYGTALGFETNDLNGIYDKIRCVIKGIIRETISTKIEKDMDCLKLLRNYLLY